MTPKSVTFPAEPWCRYSVQTVNALVPDRYVTISAAALCPDERSVQDVAHPAAAIALENTARAPFDLATFRPVGRARHVYLNVALAVHCQTLESAHRRRQARQVNLFQQLKQRLLNVNIIIL